MEGNSQAELFFPIEQEYFRCLTALKRTGIISMLPESQSLGVLGFDGKEYPMPTLEQVANLFEHHRGLIVRKVSQGFNRLELVPMAAPVLLFVDLLEAAIHKHAAEGKIFQTRYSPSNPFIPVRVNKEKQVWMWETLKQVLDTDNIVYFPKKYSYNHLGLSKSEVIHNKSICAFPGWSVGLVESLPIMPPQGQGKMAGGRKQPETGLSSREYLELLHTEPFEGETGKTLEDFMTEFLIHLETANEISNDVDDNNALWCLGQYVQLPYAEVVPTGRWIRSIGRVRLDMHRTGNKKCTKSWGASTVIRLPKP